MRERLIPLVDRLNERGWIDRWSFLAFCAVGIAGILLGKWAGVSAVAVAAGAALLIVLYAALVDLAGTGRLRSDQAGDNCYYLGLIYTLASLAYAIFTFDPTSNASAIVQGFGIALATTVMGLMLRVFFNQSRVDLVESEETARLELAQAAGRLKAELSQIVVRMNDFSRQTLQSLAEVRDASTREMEAAAGAAAASIRTGAEASVRSIEEHSAETVARMKKLNTATERVVGAFERQGDTLETVQEANAATVVSVTAVGEVARQAQAMVSQLTTSIGVLNDTHQGLASATGGLKGFAQDLQAAVTKYEESAARFAQKISEQLEEIKRAPNEGVETASNSLASAISRVETELSKIMELQHEAAERLGQQASAALEAAMRHNAALETELTLSREKVGKVHTALVDMTGTLVRHVETGMSQ